MMDRVYVARSTQNHNALEYMTQSIQANREGKSPPSLLSQTPNVAERAIAV
jgi:hypothetical protein